MTERVNHPPHYQGHPSGVECIDLVEHMRFNTGNAVKYLWRVGRKGSALEDLQKARWYLEREAGLDAGAPILRAAPTDAGSLDPLDSGNRVRLPLHDFVVSELTKERVLISGFIARVRAVDPSSLLGRVLGHLDPMNGYSRIDRWEYRYADLNAAIREIDLDITEFTTESSTDTPEPTP